jgi:endo-1,4-beta-xylanase
VADQRGFYVGAAVASPHTEAAQNILPHEFNMVGAENAFKWRYLAPKVGQYDFTAADAFAVYAAEHNLRLRGHVLIWGRAGKPADLEHVVRAAGDPAQKLEQVMREHIHTVAGRYRGQVHVWDVVNEPLAYGGTGLDDNIFTQTLGEDYIAQAFRFARQADRDAKLVLNEQIPASQYGGGEAARSLLALLKKLVDDGVPVDGVGLQSHMLMGIPSSEGFLDYLRAISDLGLFIELTEVDLRIGRCAKADDPVGAQAEAYHRLASACAQVSAVRGIMTWGVSDAETWLDTLSPFDAGAPNQPLLFDINGQRKPAYYACVDGISRRKPR